MAEIEQRNMGERMSPEEEERLMKIVVENNEKIIKLQKQLGKLQVEVGEKKRQEIMIQKEKEQEEMDRWVEEYRKRNEKEREEKEEKKRVDEEWRRVEKMRIKEERKAENQSWSNYKNTFFVIFS